MADSNSAISNFDNLSISDQLRAAPVTVAFLLASIIGALVVRFLPSHIHWFTIQNYDLISNSVALGSLSGTLDDREYWRFITPTFLHFGLFHLTFNALLIWVLGKNIEYMLGSFKIFFCIIVIAMFSNIGQYFLGGASIFGGLSGVVYGLLGFIWVSSNIAPSSILSLPQGLIGFMLIWLFLGISGIIEFTIGLNIANAAHIVGLISGMIFGIFDGLFRLNR